MIGFGKPEIMKNRKVRDFAQPEEDSLESISNGSGSDGNRASTSRTRPHPFRTIGQPLESAVRGPENDEHVDVGLEQAQKQEQCHQELQQEKQDQQKKQESQELAKEANSTEPANNVPTGASGQQEQGAPAQDQREAGADQETQKKRCDKCGKKLGLTGGFPCRCGGTYCAYHRYSDRHECNFDYREMGATEIRRDNPVIIASKLRKI